MPEIVRLSAHEHVPGGGAYDMPMSVYHAQKCPGPSVSSSGIRSAVLKSPEHFWAFSDLNEDRLPGRDDSPSLILGRAAHALIFGDEAFDEQFSFVEKDAPRRPTAAQRKAFERDGRWSDAAAEGAAFWDEWDQRAKGKTPLTHEQVDHITQMAKSIRRSPEAMHALTGGAAEVSMVWQDMETGLWIKSRPDHIGNDGSAPADLKTISPSSSNLQVACRRQIDEFGYDMQMALAAEGAQAIFDMEVTSADVVFVMAVPPYSTCVINIPEEALRMAASLNAIGRRVIAHGLSTGSWPGPAPGIRTYQPPEWRRHRYDAMSRLLREAQPLGAT